MCGSQEGSAPFHIHRRQAPTHLHTLLTFKQVDVSHGGHSDSACCGGPWCRQETTSQVGVRRKTSMNSERQSWRRVVFVTEVTEVRVLVANASLVKWYKPRVV